MVQWVTVFSTMPDNLSSIPRTHIVGPLTSVRIPWNKDAPTHTHTIKVKKKERESHKTISIGKTH